MKRIIGRQFLTGDEFNDYTGVEPTPLTFADLNTGQLPIFYRHKWILDSVDEMNARGEAVYRFLDIGCADGKLSALMATRRTVPTRGDSVTLDVDCIEAHHKTWESAEILAKSMREAGYKMTTYNSTFEDFNTERRYDAIAAFEFLEHTKDPLFCVEKMYDLLDLGGYLFITVPEQNGQYGVQDKNPFHYWTATVQSVTSVLFGDDRRWRIMKMIETPDSLIHMMIRKKVYAP